MFVGGPNTRKDFHLDESSEFFYQLKGNMELPTVQQGKRKLVRIQEGEVYLLPSRIPHSPQRPEENSLGLVIERQRSDDERDGLRYYVDFDTCDTILWERYFHCADLGHDLVPVVEAYMASEERTSGVPAGNVVADPPLQQNTHDAVPDPFSLQEWIEERRQQLRGSQVDLFPGHPDKEFCIRVVGGPQTSCIDWKHDTYVQQLEGESRLTLPSGEKQRLGPGECCTLAPCGSYTVEQPSESLALVVQQDPLGNKR